MFSLTLSRPGPGARGRLLPPGEPRPRSLFTMMELYVMSYIRPRRFSRATSEMHARSRHHSDRHPRTCCEDPWQAQAPSLTMDPRVKPEGDSAGVWRDSVAISSVVMPGLEPGIDRKSNRLNS